MGLKKMFKCNFSLKITNHFLIVANLMIFILICYMSLALDAVSPFNKINVVLVGIFCAITLVYFFINKIVPKINIFCALMFGLMCLMVINSLINNFYKFPKTPVLLCIFSLFSFLWLNENKKYLNFYFYGFLIASWLFLLTFLIKEFSAIIKPNFSYRAGSSLGNNNDVARHLAFSFAINCYFLFLFRKKSLIVIFSFTSFLCFYFIILTGSVSNLLLVLILFLAFVIRYSNKNYRKLMIIFVSLAILAGMLMLFTIPFFSSIKNRILSIFATFLNSNNSRIDASTVGRINASVFGFKLFLDSPIFGNGYNSVVNNYKIMAHNNIIEIAADYGLFALIIEEFIILYPLFNFKKIDEKEKAFTFLMCLYIFLVQFFLVVFNSKIESIILPLIYCTFENKEKSIKDNTKENKKRMLIYEVSI